MKGTEVKVHLFPDYPEISIIVSSVVSKDTSGKKHITIKNYIIKVTGEAWNADHVRLAIDFVFRYHPLLSQYQASCAWSSKRISSLRIGDELHLIIFPKCLRSILLFYIALYLSGLVKKLKNYSKLHT